MVQTYSGRRPATPKYTKFTIPLDIVSQMKSNPDNEINIFENHISLINGFKSFQDPSNIADALAYIWDEQSKWEKIGRVMGRNADSTKIFLKNSVIRRNQIVHQGDYDGFSIYRQEIDQEDTKDVLSFIEAVGGSIFSCVR